MLTCDQPFCGSPLTLVETFIAQAIVQDKVAMWLIMIMLLKYSQISVSETKNHFSNLSASTHVYP